MYACAHGMWGEYTVDVRTAYSVDHHVCPFFFFASLSCSFFPSAPLLF